MANKKREKAEKKNKDAKILCETQQYGNAVLFYTEAIELCPTEHKYWSYRADCYMRMGQYHTGLQDAKKSIQLNKTHTAGYLQIANCHKMLDNLPVSISVLKQALQNISVEQNRILVEIKHLQDLKNCKQKIKNCLRTENYLTALSYIEQYLKNIPNATKYIVYKAECLYRLGKTEEAEQLLERVTDELHFNEIQDNIIPKFKCLNIENDKKRSEAEKYNEKAKISFQMKNYVNASCLYTKAINIFPAESKYWSNRSACHIKLHNYSEGLQDALKSVEIDINNCKSYVRAATCHKYFENYVMGKKMLESAIQLEPKNTVIKKELQEINVYIEIENEINKYLTSKNYEQGLKAIEKYLELVPASKKYNTIKAENLINLHKFNEAQKVITDILKIMPKDEHALYLQANLYYYTQDINESFTRIKDIKKDIPDHTKMSKLYTTAKTVKNYIDEAKKTPDGQKIYDYLTKAINTDPSNKEMNKKLYEQKIREGLTCVKVETIIEDCTRYLVEYEDSLEILKIRAESYMILQEYEDAKDDYEQIYKREETPENLYLLKNAEILHKRETADPHSILRIKKNATKPEIKRAYTMMAKRYHTDKNNDAPSIIKGRLNRKFIHIKKAYETLINRR